jgi:3-methylornithine--L-lysine ligase
MKLVVIGGGLQGTEALYLAHHAGWDTVLIDKKDDVPAIGLCHHFYQCDVTDTRPFDALMKVISDVDLILPTTENFTALSALKKWSHSASVPMAFDFQAYAISSSKQRSDRLFSKHRLPAPKPWPNCNFPIIAKPDNSSGSRGVQVFSNKKELEAYFPSIPPQRWVLQEYVAGPSYSIEVIGYPGHYCTGQVTDLHMDKLYDCKRVTAPTLLNQSQVTQFEKISLTIAESIQLRGIMDVEVILHDNQLKLLEIDARFPSQTPTAVYCSTGMNLLTLLAQVYLQPGKLPPTGQTPLFLQEQSKEAKKVIYEHIRFSSGNIEECGEHIMVDAGPLSLLNDFHQAQEAITNYQPGQDQWVATLIKVK